MVRVEPGRVSIDGKVVCKFGIDKLLPFFRRCEWRQRMRERWLYRG